MVLLVIFLVIWDCLFYKAQPSSFFRHFCGTHQPVS
jgi:hypothetical protein